MGGVAGGPGRVVPAQGQAGLGLPVVGEAPDLLHLVRPVGARTTGRTGRPGPPPAVGPGRPGTTAASGAAAPGPPGRRGPRLRPSMLRRAPPSCRRRAPGRSRCVATGVLVQQLGQRGGRPAPLGWLRRGTRPSRSSNSRVALGASCLAKCLLRGVRCRVRGSARRVAIGRRYPWVVARRAEGTPADESLIVVINDAQPVMSRADWLRLLEADGPTDVDAHAADIVR